MNQSTSQSSGHGRQVAIVVARFNQAITGLLLQGAHETLLEAGLAESEIRVIHVPGAWELPLACRLLASSGQYQAIVALGAVVRGETAHFDFISAECTRGLMQVALESGVPVAFGVLTPENGEQALERADPARKNKGREAAQAALDMVALKAEIDGGW